MASLYKSAMSSSKQHQPGLGWASNEETPLTCGGSKAEHQEQAQSQQEQTPVNTSMNIVLLFRLQELSMLSHANFALAVLTLCYLAIQILLMTLNHQIHTACTDRDPFVPSCSSPISEYHFHLIEFWATSGYAVITAFALVYTPRAVSSICNRPLLLKIVLLFDIVATIVPALLVTCDLVFFERVSHEIEYANELTMSFVDIVLLVSLVKRSRDKDTIPSRGAPTNAIIAAVAALIALVQMAIYNSRMKDREKTAHYCEFTFEIISALISFWFCMDNKNAADVEMSVIMYGNHRDCPSCRAKAVEFVNINKHLHQLDP